MQQKTLSIRLRDGTTVLVRPVAPADRHCIEVGFTKLSSDSRYLRFFSPLSHLSRDHLDYLTGADRVNQVAWIAFDAIDSDDTGIGIARFIRLADEPRIAEIALTVIDAYQGRGLGTIFLALLYLDALELGIHTLRGTVLPDNWHVTHWMNDLGAKSCLFDGVLRIDLLLSPDLSRMPDTAAAKHLKSVVEQIRTAH